MDRNKSANGSNSSRRRLFFQNARTSADEDMPMNDDHIDTGKPIALLANFEQEPERGFVTRLRHRIDRQDLTTQLVELGWRGPIMVFLEWVGALFHLASPKEQDREGE
jgi:hypothetical protein